MVYRPRQDSYLLKEELESRDLKGKRCLDMGTGSGILAIEMASQEAQVTAADIDPEAISYAKQRSNKEGLKDDVDFIETDLFEAIDNEKEFDLIVFNPPYLPDLDEGKGQESWAGGQKGVEVTERFLSEVKEYLGSNGEALLILSSRSEIDDLMERFDLDVIEDEKTWFETLYLVKFG